VDAAGGAAPARRLRFPEARRLSGLEEARFLFLEKEFGACLGIRAPGFAPPLYDARQVALLRKLDEVLRASGLPLPAVRDRIERFLRVRERGLWTAAVTSGKGGVGKTTVAVGLAAALARLGQRPLLVDADLGLANAHLPLGLLPATTLDDLVRGAATLEEVVLDSAFGVRLVPGGSGSALLADLDPVRREALAAELGKLAYHTDTLVIDTAAGISSAVTRFLRLADDIVVVTTPNVAAGVDALGAIQAAAAANCSGRVTVLVNRCRDGVQAREVFERLARAAGELTGRAPGFLGHLTEDERLEESFQRGVPVTSLHPASRPARQFRRLARTVLAERRDPAHRERDAYLQLLGEPARAG
jgi:flagellar biosynthesis protein FlhG